MKTECSNTNSFIAKFQENNKEIKNCITTILCLQSKNNFLVYLEFTILINISYNLCLLHVLEIRLRLGCVCSYARK